MACGRWYIRHSSTISIVSLLERFSIECRKTKTTPTNHKIRKQHKGLTRTGSNPGYFCFKKISLDWWKFSKAWLTTLFSSRHYIYEVIQSQALPLAYAAYVIKISIGVILGFGIITQVIIETLLI